MRHTTSPEATTPDTPRSALEFGHVTSGFETHPDVLTPGQLPTQAEIAELYAEQVAQQETPTVRAARPGEKADITRAVYDPRSIDTILQDPAGLVESYVKTHEPTPWWQHLNDSLRDAGVTSEALSTLEITAKHSADVVVDGKPQAGQAFDVFELGQPDEPRADEASLQTVFNTLQQIDQFTGGLLAADPDRQKILLGSGIDMHANNGGDEFKGFANTNYAFINLDAIQDSAEKTGVDAQEILAAVVIHEILGHGTELLTHGSAGRYFEQHFHYSNERASGTHFDSVHETVTAKDPAHADSRPVREYSRLNAAEDLATSVDASVAEALDLKQSVDALPVMRSTPDAHRRDLILQLMDQAAQNARTYENTPGISGAELRYVTNEQGKVTGVEPARKLEINTTDGQTAVQQEVQSLLAAAQLPKEITVRFETDTGV